MTRNRITDIRTVKASELIPNPDNWRVHSTDQRAVMEHLLGTIGSVDVLKVVETAAGLMLLDGHLRADIAKDEDVQVAILDLDDAERDLVLATFDPVAAMAERSSDILASLTDRIGQDGIIGRLLEAVADAPSLKLAPVPEDPDDITEAVETVEAEGYEPTAKTGDVWALGEHRVLCGDGSNGLPEALTPFAAEIVWTDPPYGVDYTGKTKDKLKIKGDKEAGLVTLLAGVFAGIDPHMAPGCRVYIAAPPGPLNMIFRQTFAAAGWRFHQGLIWVKDSMVLGHSDHHLRHEDVLYGWKPGPGRVGRGRHAGTKWQGGHAVDSVFEIPRPKVSKEHPTMKPVALVEAHINNSSVEGDNILDPFLGSGTTLIAAEQTGRICYGIEIEPRYVDVTVARWEALTGLTAECSG